MLLLCTCSWPGTLSLYNTSLSYKRQVPYAAVGQRTVKIWELEKPLQMYGKYLAVEDEAGTQLNRH